MGGNPVQSYRDLDVWQRASDLAVLVYRLVGSLPSSERFGISDQLRRAAISIVANIAEGWGRGTTKEYLHFLSIANGSLREVEAIVNVCPRLGLCDPQVEILDHCEAVGKMLTRLRQSLQRKLQTP